MLQTFSNMKSLISCYRTLRRSSSTSFNTIISSRCYSEDDKNKGPKDKREEKSNEVLSKLNNLLKDMIDMPQKNSLELSKPTPKRKRKSEDVPTENKVDPSLVVKQVAESLGGDQKETESELMKKLLNVEDEKPELSLSEIFKGMKIDRNETPVEQKRSHQIRQILNNIPLTQSTERPKAKVGSRTSKVVKLDNIDLFGAEPLGIFSDISNYKEGVELPLWDSLQKRELKLMITHPPSNYFQEMILWTEQGKLWKFPIDNEQGLEKEQNVDFSEHIFLEKHLESWCPMKGPIRHYMELVCVGLSKNPYLTVEAKKEHIEWYKNYFEDKRQLLKEVGAALKEPHETTREIDSQ